MGGHENHDDDLVADCRMRAATDLFAHAWDPVVMAALREEPRRRHELRARIGGLSDKALTEALRRLLGHGLIERRSYPQTPPRVEYGLSALGISLVDGPMQALATWINDYGDDLLAAQKDAPQPLRRYGG